MFGGFLLAVVVFTAGVVGGDLPESPLHQVLRFLPSALPAGICRNAFNLYLDSLDRGAVWALNTCSTTSRWIVSAELNSPPLTPNYVITDDNITIVYDASTKYPDGILATNGYSLGHFDQCLDSTGKGFSGKYCLVNVRYSKVNSSHPMLPGSRFKLNRNEANLALCLPSTCRSQDVLSALQDSVYLFPILRNFHVQVKLDESQCSFVEPDREEGSFYVWMRYAMVTAAVVYLLNSYAYCATSDPGCDLEKKSDLLGCCSVARHWSKLFSAEPEGSIGCIHGLRVLALSVVIVGHRAEAIASSPLLNPDSLEKLFENPFNIIVLNGTVIVDTFFTIGGFLLCWKILKSAERGVHLTSWQIFRQRYLRLTPGYAVVILIQAQVLEGLGSGPLWKLKVGKEASNCRTNWWANLLYINNYWDPQHICIDPSWYLACDMQLLLLAHLVIHPLLRWGRFRIAPFLLALTASFWIPFAVTYSNNLDPTVIPDLATVGQTAFNKTNLLLYITAYCRTGPYLIGIAAAFLLDRLHKTQHWPSESFWAKGWYLAAVCMVGSVVLGYPFFTPMKVHPLLTALYAASFRTVYSLGVAFIIIASACGRGGGFLSAASLLPLSRISFSVYLTHTLWMQLSYSWIRSPLHSTDLFQACLILSDLIFCTILGMVFYLLVECPASELTSRLFTRKCVAQPAQVQETRITS